MRIADAILSGLDDGDAILTKLDGPASNYEVKRSSAARRNEFGPPPLMRASNATTDSLMIYEREVSGGTNDDYPTSSIDPYPKMIYERGEIEDNLPSSDPYPKIEHDPSSDTDDDKEMTLHEAIQRVDSMPKLRESQMMPFDANALDESLREAAAKASDGEESSSDESSSYCGSNPSNVTEEESSTVEEGTLEESDHEMFSVDTEEDHRKKPTRDVQPESDATPHRRMRSLSSHQSDSDTTQTNPIDLSETTPRVRNIHARRGSLLGEMDESDEEEHLFEGMKPKNFPPPMPFGSNTTDRGKRDHDPGSFSRRRSSIERHDNHFRESVATENSERYNESMESILSDDPLSRFARKFDEMGGGLRSSLGNATGMGSSTLDESERSNFEDSGTISTHKSYDVHGLNEALASASLL